MPTGPVRREEDRRGSGRRVVLHLLAPLPRDRPTRRSPHHGRCPMKTTKAETTFTYLLLFAFALTILVPFAAIVLAAFNTPGAQLTGMTWPASWHWANIRLAWTDGHFRTLMGASLRVEAIVVPLTLALAATTGYALGGLRTPGRRFWSLLFLLGMTLPIEVVIVPLYFDLRDLGLTDSLVTVGVVESGAFLPFGVFWMRTHFAALPREILESAAIDGAGPWRLFRHIHLPLAAPALTTLGVIYFMWCWNQFLLVLTIISDTTKRTAPAGLGFFVGPHSMDYPLLSAATLIVITPIVVVYVAFQKKFVAGLLQGAVK